MSNIEIEIKNAEMLGRTDSVYATKFYVMQKQIDELQQENHQLKMIIEEYERLNKEKGRGFKITSIKQYNIDKLVKCEENWNKLKEYIEEHNIYYKKAGLEMMSNLLNGIDIIEKIKELERGINNE